jgi:hypothetical protein
VATAAKYSDLINKVTLLQNGVFCESRITAGLQIYLKEARSEKEGEKREASSEKGRSKGVCLVSTTFSFMPGTICAICG